MGIKGKNPAAGHVAGLCWVFGGLNSEMPKRHLSNCDDCYKVDGSTPVES